MDEIIIPIFVCVVLPIAIVAIIFYAKINQDNKRTKVLIKAIEANNNIDADKIAAAMSDSKKEQTPQQLLNKRLLRGCMFTLAGLVLVVLSIITYLNEYDFSSDPVFMPAMFGGLSIAIGLSYLIVYFLTRSQVEK